MDENQPKNDLNLMLDLANEFQEESDRAAAVLAAAYLDNLLGKLIAVSMILEYDEVEELLYRGGYAPLGTFSARIDIAYLSCSSERFTSDLSGYL